IPSRRSTADFCPCGASSYSASTRARYSAGYVRRDGLGAGSVAESPVVGGRDSSMMVIRSPPSQWATPQQRGVSHQPDREGGRSTAEASLLLTCMVIASITVAPIIGTLTGRHPLRRTWLVLGGAGVVALAWVAILVPTTPRPLWQLIAFALVVGAGGPMSLIGMDFARTHAARERLGSATGFVNMGGFVSTIISVLMVGVLLQSVSPAGVSEYTLGEYRIAFAALAVPWIIGVVGVFTSRRDTRAAMAADGVLVPTVRDVWR